MRPGDFVYDTMYTRHDDLFYEVIEVGDYVAWITIYEDHEFMSGHPGHIITDPFTIDCLCRKLRIRDFTDRYIAAYVNYCDDQTLSDN